MKKRFSAFLLALALLWLTPLSACAAGEDRAMPTAAPSQTVEDFTDIPAGADYAQAVAWCKARGLMDGVGEGRFAPEGTLTRAMMAAVLYRAAGEPGFDAAAHFADAEIGQWYYNAVAWADVVGYMKGYGDGVFGVDDPVSVEQLSVILDRYLGRGDTWTGNPAKAIDATRAQVAVALMDALATETAEPDTPSPEPETGGRVLVAYFSCTGTTGGVAEKIAQAVGGNLFEIMPAEPYTGADLNYTADCRANDEQNDDGARPAIASDCVVERWADYDVVFLGHPIWWGIPPKIMRTFCEQYDWTGKTVVGFCTSGGSGYSNQGLPKLTVGAEWLDTRRLNGASQSDVDEWIKGLELPQTAERRNTVNKLSVSFNGHTYPVTLADNSSADALVALLEKNGGSITIAAHDFGSFEKVGELPENLPRNDEPIDTQAGDLILYQGSQITLYYAANSWTFTRLGRLDGDLGDLKSDLGDGDVEITYTLAE